MEQRDSRDGARGVLELLESQHRSEARLDVAVILLNDIVEILTRADRDGPELSILGPKLANGPMGCLLSVRVNPIASKRQKSERNSVHVSDAQRRRRRRHKPLSSSSARGVETPH
jgi:hypothetical protein